MTGRLLVAPLRRGGRILRVKTGRLRGRIAGFLTNVKHELGDMLPISLAVFAVFIIILIFSQFRPLHPVLQIVLGSALCGVLIPIVSAALHEKELQAFQRREHTIDGECKHDGAPYNAAVMMQKAAFSDRENFLNEFRSVPLDAKSVVLVLRQSRKKLWYGKPPYTVESMIRQLEKRKNDARAAKIPVEWVCIENKYNTFEAYLSYARFETDILHCKNPAYAELLNIGEVEEFRRKLQDHKDGEDGLKKTCVARPNTILGLNAYHLPMWVTRRQVLTKLLETGNNDVMLVSDDRKRLGIVTLNNLLRKALAFFLPRASEQQVFERKIREWTELCRARVAALEAVDIPSPPAETGDDRPDYDSMMPTDGLRRRGADLPFTPP